MIAKLAAQPLEAEPPLGRNPIAIEAVPTQGQLLALAPERSFATVMDKVASVRTRRGNDTGKVARVRLDVPLPASAAPLAAPPADEEKISNVLASPKTAAEVPPPIPFLVIVPVRPEVLAKLQPDAKGPPPGPLPSDGRGKSLPPSVDLVSFPAGVPSDVIVAGEVALVKSEGPLPVPPKTKQSSSVMTKPAQRGSINAPNETGKQVLQALIVTDPLEKGSEGEHGTADLKDSSFEATRISENPPEPILPEHGPQPDPVPARADALEKPDLETIPPGRLTGEVSGIGGAKSSPWMKKAEKNDLARPIEGHYVPSVGALAEKASDEIASGPSRAANASGNEERPHVSSGLPSDFSTTMDFKPVVASADSIRLRPAATLREQVQTQISNWAVEIKRTKAEVMEVVLKPDAQTELSLRLTMQHGLVEVAAEFKRGDLTSLSGHWQQLQQALSSQGIRLSAIQPSASTTFSDLPAGQQSSRQPDPQTDWSDGMAPKILTRPKATAPQTKIAAPLSSAGRGWENWA